MEPGIAKYGIRLYGASWVPHSVTVKEESDAVDSEPLTQKRHVILAGGAGEGIGGIRNGILLPVYDFESEVLSNQTVTTHSTGSALPYRIAVHPGGGGVLCSFRGSCGHGFIRWFEWDAITSGEGLVLGLKSSEKVSGLLEDADQQLAMTFNKEGSLLATGGEDGRLRVFKWPILETVLDEANAHTSIKDLAFSPDGKFLISMEFGCGKIWDVSTSKCVASLHKEKREFFGFCGFSQSTETDQVLFVTIMKGSDSRIVKFDTNCWGKISSVHVVGDPISALSVSPDGKLLAVGTVKGDIFFLNSDTTRRHSVVRKAHMGIVTSLAFSQDSRALVSTCLDTSARVTPVEDDWRDELRPWINMIIFILAVVTSVHFAKTGHPMFHDRDIFCKYVVVYGAYLLLRQYTRYENGMCMSLNRSYPGIIILSVIVAVYFANSYNLLS